MMITKLTTLCGMVVAVGLVGSSGALVVHRSLAAGTDGSDGLAQLATAHLAPHQAQPEDQKQEDAEKAARRQSLDNLKHLSLAMHNYVDAYGQFPPAAVYSSDGKPLLSWRVLLLPYLDQGQLYADFKLDEPWDGPTNKKLLAKMPSIFSTTPGKAKGAQDTIYQVFTGKGTIFPSPKSSKISDITDGTSNTILIVEGASAVPWTKPADLAFDAKTPLPKLGGVVKQGFLAAFADGSVRFFKQSIKEANLRAMITSNGGEVIVDDND